MSGISNEWFQEMRGLFNAERVHSAIFSIRNYIYMYHLEYMCSSLCMYTYVDLYGSRTANADVEGDSIYCWHSVVKIEK